MRFELAIMILEGELSNTKHSLRYNNPHKNSNQYKAYKWRIEELKQNIEYLRAQASKPDQSDANCAILNISGSASFDDVRHIWNAAEKYMMHETGEICKGDEAYEEDVPDLETYYERHYR